jgi:chorismate mutase/prephenate dehydratase
MDQKPALDELRAAIDRLDEEILEKINRRLELAREIGRRKQEMGLKTFNNARESQVLQRLGELNPGPLSEAALKQIFREIMAAARELQSRHRIAFLGPEASFTHLAALSHFGGTVACVPFSGVAEIFAAVEKGRCHYGLVPVENSIEGAVTHTQDLLFSSALKICGEHYQSISHGLLTAEKLPPENIRTVYSHPQALAQCRQWLRENLPDAVLSECASTAEAARRVAARKGSSAAIAGTAAAELYGLHVAAEKIEDLPGNTTRFLVLGPEDSPPSGRDKTTILFVTPHHPGALHRVLTPMAEFDINMVKLESRPVRDRRWSYFFIADLEGHREEEKVARMLAEIDKICPFMKILGSYPRAA